MEAETTSPQPQSKGTSGWSRLRGQIQVHSAGRILRRGKVDDVMPDGSGIWLAAEGVNPRAYLHNDGEIQLSVEGE
jgi:hypothetical protein